MNMDYALLFPGRFLKSAQFLGKDVHLTIAGVRTEALPSDKGGEKVKGIVAFNETKLELVLNRTNAECVKGMFGRETDEWIGKRVTFYPAPFSDPFTGEQTTCIRVRGSPDIDKDVTVEVTLPRKKPMRVALKKTASAKPGKTNGKAKAAPVAEQAPDEPPPFGMDEAEEMFTGDAQ